MTSYAITLCRRLWAVDWSVLSMLDAYAIVPSACAVFVALGWTAEAVALDN